MHYDNVKMQAVFTGKPVAHAVGENPLLASLSCDDTLTVQLKKRAGASVSEDVAAGDLDLDWMEAVGNVNASGAQFGPNNVRLTDLRFNAQDQGGNGKGPLVPGKLKYFGETGTIAIPGEGYLYVNNDKPAQSGKHNSRGSSAFHWEGSLSFDGATHEVTFLKNVVFIFEPKESFAFSKEAKKATLNAEQLKATLAPKDPDSPGKDAANVMDMSAQDLKNVRATGNVTLSAAPYVIKGDDLNYDVVTSLVTVEQGKGNAPGVLMKSGSDTVGFRKLQFDMTKDKGFFRGEGLQGNLEAMMPK
jgi:hypothetical protein